MIHSTRCSWNATCDVDCADRRVTIDHVPGMRNGIITRAFNSERYTDSEMLHDLLCEYMPEENYTIRFQVI